MPVFEYKALSAAGKPVQGLQEAESPKTLRAALKRDGVFLTEVLGEKQQQAQQAREVNVRRWVVGRVGADDLAIMTRQLAVLVHAGIPLVEALAALVEQVEHERLKRVVSDVRQRVNEGASLADALAAHAKVFSTLYVNMIRAGESSGALDVVLVRLADFTESQARLRSKVMGALTYPAAMAVVGGAIMLILFTVVIPKITKIFEDTQVTLPWTTKLLIGFATFGLRLVVGADPAGRRRGLGLPALEGDADRPRPAGTASSSPSPSSAASSGPSPSAASPAPWPRC